MAAPKPAPVPTLAQVLAAGSDGNGTGLTNTGQIVTGGAGLDTEGGSARVGDLSSPGSPVPVYGIAHQGQAGFFGNEPVNQPLLPAVGSVTVQDVVAALVALGLVAQA